MPEHPLFRGEIQQKAGRDSFEIPSGSDRQLRNMIESKILAVDEHGDG